MLSDWQIISGIVIAVLGAIGGAIAWLSGAFRQRGSDQHDRQKARDDAATKDADRTLTAVWTLLDQLQEEVKRKGDEIAALNIEVTTLKAKVGDLERQLRDR